MSVLGGPPTPSSCLMGLGMRGLASPHESRVPVVGGSFTGFCVAFAMHNKFLVTVVDALWSLSTWSVSPGIQVVQVSQAQVVEVMAEIPQLQLVEKAL